MIFKNHRSDEAAKQGELFKKGKRRVRDNDGSPGVDKEGFGDIEKQGLDKFLQELGEDIRKRSYIPSPVKRVWIEKANGGKRPLGIPTIRDRVIQMTCKMLIEPLP